MPRPHRHPAFWFSAFVAWFATLWWLSSVTPGSSNGPEIPHLDKIAHFGFFFGGAGLLSAALFGLNPSSPNWRRITLTTILVLAAVGALDEWHQTHTPGRSGNDLGDWLADVLGATAGTLVFRRFHHLLATPVPRGLPD